VRQTDAQPLEINKEPCGLVKLILGIYLEDRKLLPYPGAWLLDYGSCCKHRHRNHDGVL